jgi:hypothetical protein
MNFLSTFGGINDKYKEKVEVMYLSMICYQQGLIFILAN